MEKTEFTPEKDGFYGIYYPNPGGARAAREFPGECKKARIDADEKVRAALGRWMDRKEENWK